MTLTERLTELVRAAFSGLYVVSHEHDDAIAELARLCRHQGWTLATWDLERGLAVANAGEPTTRSGGVDPLAAVRALGSLATPDGTALLVLRNFHRYLTSPEIVQALDATIAAGKQARTFVVVQAPLVQIPVELERHFLVVEHDLPGREPLEAIARALAVEPGELPEGDGLDRLLDAAAGLTRVEAENAFALSLVRHGRLAPEVLWELKGQTLKKGGLLSLDRGGETFADLGGLEALKAFCTRALRPGGGPDRPRARGVLLLGVPGTGKSMFCKALGAETGRPTVILDVGALKGSLVGQTEDRTRRALAQIDAMAPCVAMLDEIEKALAGVQTSGQTDGGVSSGLLGTLLRYLDDRARDVFFIATSNDIRKLPPELTRAERLDGVFFLDLPDRVQKEAIWRLALARYGLDPGLPRPRDPDWSGAEIQACCRLAALLEVSPIEASQQIVPVAVTAGEAVEQLRSWASGRCLDADRPGLYTRGSTASERPARGVRRGPSPN